MLFMVMSMTPRAQEQEGTNRGTLTGTDAGT
jgi:hypothetical protein